MLALLRLFQPVVNVDVLHRVLHPEQPNDWSSNCPRSTNDSTVDTLADLLSRAAEIGLLIAHNRHVLEIHPALSWFFANLFDRHFPLESARPPRSVDGRTPSDARACAARSFVEVMGPLGAHLSIQLDKGDDAVGRAMAAEEGNLLRAVDLARTQGWRDSIISPMLGLQALYRYTERHGEWARLVQAAVPDFVDPGTDGPLPGRDAEWSFVTSWRVGLARAERRWEEAERLQRLLVERERTRCAPALAAPPGIMNRQRFQDVGNLAAAESELGSILWERDNPDCVAVFERARELSNRIGDINGVARAAFNLGHAYLSVSSIRNLDRASQLYRRAFEVADERNRFLRAACLGQLGSVALERLKEAIGAGAPVSVRDRLFNASVQLYTDGLGLLGEESPLRDRLTFRGQLCVVYNNAGRSDLALPHCREALRLAESGGDPFAAAGTRLNLARALAQTGRLRHGLAYAEAALRRFRAYGNRASEEARTAQGMIDQIERRLNGGGG